MDNQIPAQQSTRSSVPESSVQNPITPSHPSQFTSSWKSKKIFIIFGIFLLLITSIGYYFVKTNNSPSTSQTQKVNLLPTPSTIPTITQSSDTTVSPTKQQTTTKRILVGFNKNMTQAEKETILATAQKNGAIPGTIISSIKEIDVLVINVSQVPSIEQAIAIYQKIKGVAYAEPDSTIHIN